MVANIGDRLVQFAERFAPTFGAIVASFNDDPPVLPLFIASAASETQPSIVQHANLVVAKAFAQCLVTFVVPSAMDGLGSMLDALLTPIESLGRRICTFASTRTERVKLSAYEVNAITTHRMDIVATILAVLQLARTMGSAELAKILEKVPESFWRACSSLFLEYRCIVVVIRMGRASSHAE